MMLAVVFFATFMDGVDGSIVNVALPNIGADFGIDTATVSWTSIIYMMVLAGTLVAFARVAADKGVRKVMAGGLLVFTIGSLMCGLSPSFSILIASRAVQAVGAGMMAATGPMCCTEHLPPEKLGFGLSIVTIGASVGFAVGPALGGAIVEFVSWHWIFLINIPLGAVAIPLMLKAVPPGSKKNSGVKLDVLGTVLLFAAITLVTFAIEVLSYSELRVVSAVSAIAGIIVLVLFVRTEKSCSAPLLNLGMFRDWQFTSIFLCLMMVNMIFMGMLYLLPFYGEICLDMSSATVGLFLLISAVVTAVFGMPVAKLSDLKGRKAICVMAGLFAAAGFFLQAFFTRDMNTPILVISLVLMGLSWACVGGPMASRLVEHAGEERDMASSLTNEAYYIGGAIGTAMVAMLFTIFSATDGIDIQNVSSSAFMDGFAPTAYIVVGISLLIAFLSLIVKDSKKE